MKLSFTLEPLMSSWAPQRIFNQYYNWFIENNQDIETEYINIDGFNKTPCGLYSPHNMTIRNVENKKYMIITYWDRPDDFTTDYNGWDIENCVEILTSAGVTDKVIATPTSYCSYSLDHENIAKKIIKNFESKSDNNLLFRGLLYGQRKELFRIFPDIITEEKLNMFHYLEELNNNKICLSLNGAAEICNRDIEILSVGSVLFRPKLKQVFKNPLIDEFHYIGFEEDDDPKKQIEIIKDKFEDIKNKKDLLKAIAENGYNWYVQNGTIDGNVNVLKETIKIEKLK
jgi:hypothetical protein